MKLSSWAVALAASLPLSEAKFRNGFNLAANKEDGSCKTEADWHKDFKTMKGLPGHFNQARLYATSDCNTLQNAVPAAKKAGVKILVGVWATPDSHYQAEKTALIESVQKHGTKWISAITVGSEDLYRNETTPDALAQQVYDVRGLIGKYKGGKGIQISHVDTYTEWIKPHAKSLIKAVDFIGSDAYPYYQGKPARHAKKVFYKSLKKTKHAVGKKPIWITETGWCVAGPNDKKATCSKKNAAHYWKTTVCKLLKTHNTFYYTLEDYWAASQGIPSFGVVGQDGKALYPLKC